ncbi:MAG: hypothetical protein FWB78_10855, partial [Treponema sp.]|nr:hypothetical protein [Treponema sp.]
MKTRPQYLFRNTRGLVFVYILLCVLTVLFTRSFFWETLYEGSVPDPLSLAVFFTIPVVLFIFLGIAIANLVSDLVARRPGIKFSVRLLACFIVIVVFSTAPMAIVTNISISEVVRFWHSIDADTARDASRAFAVESFSFHIERFDDTLRETSWPAVVAHAARAELADDPAEALPAGIASVQDFVFTAEGWRESGFIGR